MTGSTIRAKTEGGIEGILESLETDIGSSIGESLLFPALSCCVRRTFADRALAQSEKNCLSNSFCTLGPSLPEICLVSLPTVVSMCSITTPSRVPHRLNTASP